MRESRCFLVRADHGGCECCAVIRETRNDTIAVYHLTWEQNWLLIGRRKYATGYLDGATGKPPREDIDGVTVI